MISVKQFCRFSTVDNKNAISTEKNSRNFIETTLDMFSLKKKKKKELANKVLT